MAMDQFKVRAGNGSSRAMTEGVGLRVGSGRPGCGLSHHAMNIHNHSAFQMRKLRLRGMVTGQMSLRWSRKSTQGLCVKLGLPPAAATGASALMRFRSEN